ncbi:MAG: Nudix family hydrolase [Halorhodospira sp.]
MSERAEGRVGGSEPIPVVAAVIRSEEGRVLVQRRPQGRDHGGLWEFPGGKVEPGESVPEALARELGEELGIHPWGSAKPVIRVPWDYGGRRVVLSVLEVTAWSGAPVAREGQELAWLTPAEMDGRAWPAANRPIIRALQLPDRYWITPQGPAGSLEGAEAVLAAGVPMVQLRRPDLGPEALLAFARQLRARCDAWGAWLLVNGPEELARALGADGVHWPARALAERPRRPAWARWVGASCHDGAELAAAAACGADFALLSPVCRTASHPHRPAMGWSRFAELVAEAPLPVYALGGVGPAEIATAHAHGGQGVAAIRGLLPAQAPGCSAP